MSDLPVEFEAPVKASSTLNSREHWNARARRVLRERHAAIYRYRKAAPAICPAIAVTLTRVAPRALDSDNLQGALKAVRDAVASCMRVDDASPLVEWRYAQAKGTACVRVRIERLP